ncbi:BppU family phage baseplate upper protein [Bacillus atrophaeus]|uniref:BppU family phage baseplate upper protein n=1 Tax=Bacillus atrophaeus TaxID=1452 RepID=UPI00255B7A68|nr:BppU family phage baseplate upper protein [Bacillus atrophaeus]MDL5141134.1 BppU family phage baseplate upper protein [Bacillus atrophaeus]
MNTTSQGAYRSAFKFSTQDVGTAKLIFNLRKDDAPLPLSAVTGKLILVPANGKKRVRDVTLVDKVNGIAEYVLDDEEIKMYGFFQCELVLVYSNKQAMSAHKFGFEVTQSLMDQDIAPVGEYYIDDFETLKAKIVEMYDSAIQTLEELKKKFEDLENIETKEGAQKKADAVQANVDNHLNDKKNPHSVTKSQVGLSAVTNDTQAKKVDFDKHTSDTSNPHKVTAAQVGLGNVINEKQATYAQLLTHDSNGIRHTSQVEKDKWNGSQLYKITQDNGLAKYLSGADFNTVTDTGFYYISSASTALNAPVNNNGYLMVYNYGTYAYQEYTSYSSSDTSSSGRRKFMRNKVASSDTWTTWREIESVEGSQAKADKALTEAKAYTDTKVSLLPSTWTTISLINGAVASPTVPLRYRTKNGGDEIQINGGFKSALGTIIASGLPEVKYPTEFLVATVGTYGYLRMDYRTNGDLYLAGGTVNSEASISKISVNATIPIS